MTMSFIQEEVGEHCLQMMHKVLKTQRISQGHVANLLLDIPNDVLLSPTS